MTQNVSMGNLLLSNKGAISSAEFIRAGSLLILISIVLGLSNLVNVQIGQVLSIVNMVMIYAWMMIWIKRLRTGGKSGWMCAVYVLLYVGISIAALLIMLMFYGGEGFMEMVLEKASETISDAELQIKMEGWVMDNILPMTVTKSLASIATLYIGDKTIPKHVEN